MKKKQHTQNKNTLMLKKTTDTVLQLTYNYN